MPSHHSSWREIPYEPTNERVSNSATLWNSIPNDLKKNSSWVNTDSPTDWLSPVHMSSRLSNHIWVEHTIHHHRLQQTGCTSPYASLTIFSPDDQLFIEIIVLHPTWSPTLHLYVKSNSSKSHSASQEPKYTNSFIRVASPNGCAFTADYVPCPKDETNRSSL